ncbi:M56 family metallopeptidase [Teredinibacter haidensis]|uniref:M56 family metallopeptidase n=1 Tax=Teredinibacter haidensis TaxID=2731755 RepID=UPI000948BF01|nr:M56 family metallopeptidase [Teredinibacter haidensis]
MISVDLMHIFSDYWLKPMIGFTFVLLFLRRANFRSAALSHRILSLVLGAMAILIALLPVMPTWTLEILPQWLASHTRITFSPNVGGFDNCVFYGLIAIYILVFCWVSSFTLWSIKDAQALTVSSREADAQEAKVLGPIEQELNALFDINGNKRLQIVISNEIQTPLVWKYQQPAIVLPEAFNRWPVARLKRVLAHEYAHIERNDWLTKIITRIACMVFWPIPLVWLLSRKINWYAEIACDDRVVQLLDCRGEYADDLLNLSSDQKHFGFTLSYLRNSELYARINLVLDPCRSKNRPSYKQSLAIGLMALLGLSPIATTKIVTNKQFDTLWELGVYPLPSHVPLLEVPEKSPIADSKSRVRWYIQQQQLGDSRVQASEAKQEDSRNQLASDKSKKEWLGAPRPQYIRPEEEMVISVAPPRAHTIDLSKKQRNAFAISAPSVAVNGYIPLKTITPQYPRFALQRNITGKVVVRFDVNESGQVVNPVVIKAEPGKVFNRSVLNAVKEFKFMPLTIDGVPVITKNVSETFVFTI